MPKGYKHLTKEQRYTIAQMLKQGDSLRKIAKCIEVSVSSISREVRRNRTKQGYLYRKAQALSEERQTWRVCPRKFTPRMRRLAERLLVERQWSPEQISGRLRLEGKAMVGKTTLYKWLHEDKFSGGTLYKHCRHSLSYRKRRLSIPWEKRGRKTIHERPACIDAKERFGDFEMDTIVGASGKEAILTLVDRRTSYAILALLPEGRKADALSKIAIKRLAFLHRRGELHSITTDNGVEFSDFARIERKFRIPVYFARPYCSTDKPHIENLNKLIRQYLPKGVSFKSLKTSDLTRIEALINSRPRKSLGYRSPTEILYFRK